MDTICAIATGNTISAIGIIRISGENAVNALAGMFSPMPKEEKKLTYGKLVNSSGELLDMCMAMYCIDINSYTGENYAEIQCHGSPVVMREILDCLFERGVRQAKPGEFTKRAFLNGKVDLVGAEAIVDLIDAQSKEAAVNAANQLSGAVSGKINKIYDDLVNLSSHYHAVLDYPDEDIEDFEMSSYLSMLRTHKETLEKLLKTFERGKTLSSGIPTAIVGRPNAGKSSLLNALLGYDRAIVTDIPGTTRDTIEETVRLGKVTLRLIDTAGIRESDDAVEKLGVERSEEAMKNASLVINVIDGTSDDKALEGDYLNVYNKCDLPSFRGGEINISCRTGEGLDALEKKINEMFPLPDVPAGEILTNLRQAQSVSSALEYISSAIDSMEKTPDIVLTELEGAMEAIGELNGKTIREDVTNRIFERFCVGK